jgi:ribosomal protein L7/L12
LVVGVLMRAAMRTQVAQLITLASTIERASDQLASRVGRIADRTERVEKALFELIERADAAMSINGLDFKAYREAMRDAATNKMRELLVKGDEISAINLWRQATGSGVREAFDRVESLEREMNVVREPALINGHPDRH